MSELETKVSEAVRVSLESDGSVDGAARAAIAAMRAHSGGGYEAAARECERRKDEAERGYDACTARGDHKTAAQEAGAANAYAQAARIIREQRVREVGEAEARAVVDGLCMDGYAVSADGAWEDLVKVMRAAGLCVAVPDTEWTALVAERDGLRRDLAEARAEAQAETLRASDRLCERDEAREQLAAATAERDGLRAEVEKERKAALSGAALLAFKAECYDLRDQLAAATKRAEAAEREVARWRDAFRGNPPEACRANYDALTEGLTAAQNARDAAEARVRDLEARPVVDAGALARVVSSVLECVNWANNHAQYDDGDESRRAVREELKYARGRLATLLPRAALNGEG